MCNIFLKVFFLERIWHIVSNNTLLLMYHVVSCKRKSIITISLLLSFTPLTTNNHYSIFKILAKSKRTGDYIGINIFTSLPLKKNTVNCNRHRCSNTCCLASIVCYTLSSSDSRQNFLLLKNQSQKQRFSPEILALASRLLIFSFSAYIIPSYTIWYGILTHLLFYSKVPRTRYEDLRRFGWMFQSRGVDS